MKRIAILGTHGSAKTTLVYKLAAFFKMKDKNAVVIHETARQSPFPINLDVVYQTTIYVVTSQIKKELEAEAQGFEISISDRTPSDAFIYLNHLQRDNNYTHLLEGFCMEWLKKYDALVYLEPSEGFAITADGIRASGEDYQKAIRDDFRVMLDNMKKKYQDEICFLKANSSQVFDKEKCQILLEKIDRSIYEQNRTYNLV